MPSLPLDPLSLKSAAKALTTQAKACNALARAAEAGDPKRLAKAALLAEKAGSTDLAALVAGAQAWLEAERTGRRQRLAEGLKAGAEAEGFPLVVVSRDPLELRLAPLGASIDVENDRAELTFGRCPVATCRAEAGAMLAARAKAVASLEGKNWNPADFHRALFRSWRRTRDEENNDWVSLAALLPELALARQPKAFRVDPQATKFVPYPRAQFTYDLWRLRRDAALSLDGWRLSLGPATGDSTRDKQRVFFVEDAAGQGQYQLTIRFSKESA